MDRRGLAIGLGALLVVIAAFFGLSLLGRDDAGERQAAKIREDRQKAIENACASQQTYQGLKKLVFDQAARLRTGDNRTNFDILAQTAFVRMENPVVEERDDSLGRTLCSGEFILELPPGAEKAFRGARRLRAQVQYEVQAAADGSGPVFSITGAEPIVGPLSAFQLEQRLALPPGTAGQEPDGSEVADDSVGLPYEPGSLPPIDQGTPGAGVGQWSNPSFDCLAARSRSEIMVCGSERLARRDRRMNEVFVSAMAEADPRTRQILLQTRGNFLAYRDRCLSDECIEEAYEDRVEEIRDIMRAAD